MVTHNMELALRYGNRLIMMHEGRVVVDINQEQKANLTVNDLVIAFERASGKKFADDSILLQHNWTGTLVENNPSDCSNLIQAIVEDNYAKYV